MMFLAEALSALVAAVATLFSILLVWRRIFPDRSSKTLALVVLGDIGRSPRMMYHAKSFARHGWTTYIIAYRDSKVPTELEFDPHIHFVHVARPLSWSSEASRPVFVACLPFRVIFGALSLLWALVFRLPFGPTFMFVQNPPALPTLPVVQLAALLRHSRVIIDWHNTGYSILALRLGERHPICRLAKALELTFGQSAYAHLFVTKAMKHQLKKAAKLKGRTIVLHDRPPTTFHHLTEEEAHDLFFKLPFINNRDLLDWAQPDHEPTTKVFERTAFSVKESGSSKAHLVKDRPALAVSATSWTADEDFEILLDALSEYDRAAIPPTDKPEEALPRLLVVITGRGAGKAAFEARLSKREKQWQRVQVRTAWLEHADYPKLLGSADLGLSFHTSTSGADLPMKVVDMFGSGLPVCALDFACLSELVKDGVNGRTFADARGLADRLVSLLRGFPAAKFPSELDMLKAGIRDARYDEAAWCTWDENWDRVVLPVVTPRRDRML